MVFKVRAKSGLLALCFLFPLFAARAEVHGGLQLKDCGSVVGHEMGLWDFFQWSPSPEQVDKVLRSELKFVKISLRKLKDGVWVVNHDATRTIMTADRKAQLANLSELTWPEVEEMRSDPRADVPIFRAEEYFARDQQRLCWMLTTKVAPDKNLVDLVTSLKMQERTVFLTDGLSDVEFYSRFSPELDLHFAGRVGSQVRDLEAYRPYVSRLWAMEIDPTDKTETLIQAVHAMGLKAYVDSMRFSKTYELFDTACEDVFKMGADITQTNRPLECLSRRER